MNPVAPISGIEATNSVLSSPVSSVSASDTSFSDHLKSAATDTVDTIRSAEHAMKAGLEGTAGPQEVVNAILAAETSLQTVIAIREKAVNAYNEILRMQV